MAERHFGRFTGALLILLLFLFPLMLLLARAEGTPQPPTLLFWLLLILPLLILPWLWRAVALEERARDARATRREPDDAAGADMSSLVNPLVDVDRSYVRAGIPIVEGRLRAEAARAYDLLEKVLAPRRLTPLIEDRGSERVRIIGLPKATQRELERRPSAAINVILFLATIATTIWTGAMHQGVNLLRTPGEFMVGVPYSAALLGILGVHELGHYVAGRLHGITVTLPYFVPVPMGLGTFGAFIQIKSLIKTRRAVFDVGIAGPLAGLVIALPALYFGLRNAPAVSDDSTTGVHLGSSLLLAIIHQLANGGQLGDTVIRLSPVAFAGWIGLFITALNLMPVGQLDGGHIAYGLFGQRRARQIGVAVFLSMLGLGLFIWPGLLTWALLIALMAGFSHIPALDDVTPPDRKRFALGAVALAILLLTILPLPAALLD